MSQKILQFLAGGNGGESLLADRFERFVSPGISSYRLYQWYLFIVYLYVLLFSLLVAHAHSSQLFIYSASATCGAIIFTIWTSKKCLPLSFGLWICKMLHDNWRGLFFHVNRKYFTYINMNPIRNNYLCTSAYKW